MINILIVEDDKDLNFLATSYLKEAGYNIVSCFNGLEAYNKFSSERFDLIISDIMMPELDGYELAKKIREVNEIIPIIFMSARDDKPSKQLGYKIGVDDYITKPFDFDELVFKVNAIIRRLNISISKELIVGNLKMNKEERTVSINGEEISFTVREFDILYAMLSYPKKTFTRGKLMEDFWGFDSSATSRTVDVYMAKLRDKTKNCDGFEIQTVHGLGYKVILK
ncbi:MAG: response regulator transcription factor [Bacilli bacterium]|nr:response regulator transcription factor [Bacilli bacterium]